MLDKVDQDSKLESNEVGRGLKSQAVIIVQSTGAGVVMQMKRHLFTLGAIDVATRKHSSRTRTARFYSSSGGYNPLPPTRIPYPRDR